MRLQNLDIDLLRAFMEVASTRSFTRAAERLNRVQSAVSSQIKRLEKIAGVRLFDRSRRTVTLTKEGEILLEYAERILRLNDAAFGDLGMGEQTERVRVGVADSVSHFITLALARFAKIHPKLQIDIHCERSWKVLELLNVGEIDLALVLQEMRNADRGLIRSERLVWAATADSEAPMQTPLPLAVFGPGCALRTVGISALDRTGRRWRPAYSSPCRDGLLVAVRAGLAVTIAAASTLEHGLVPVEANAGLPVLPDMAIVLERSKRRLAPAAAALADVIQETVNDARPVIPFPQAAAS